MENLSYPIGKFIYPNQASSEQIKQNISVISNFPERLKREVSSLDDEKLDTKYRPEGWTIRQVVHHCADSHMQCISRIKMALTEGNPVIKPYFEDRWAELEDSQNFSIKPSLQILEGVHERWVILLESLTDETIQRTYFHPGEHRSITILESIFLYSWHCNHHLAHITELKKRKDWT
ncbi:MAG: putative metal-dependent hydrolase [Saprospiraceae bacterium]